MNGNIRDYAKLGLVFHMIYPDSIKDPKAHAGMLKEFIQRTDIESFDCCIPYRQQEREEIVKAFVNCRKDVGYALSLFPCRKISFGSSDFVECETAKFVLSDQILQAAAIGAKNFVFVSGADYPYEREKAKQAFYEFCIWFCSELKQYGITALLEPFDRTIDKKYLYGSIDECNELTDKVSRHFNNIGIELDIAHLPLMGEDIRSSVLRCGSRIKRVHLGNSVLKDTNHPLYGDRHPPIGIDGGEIGLEELVVALRALCEIGYMDKSDRKPLILEMQPFDENQNRAEETIRYSFGILDKAWALV